jgi:translation initiation factor 1
MCPSCGHPEENCRCSKNSTTPQGDSIVRIRREVQGRKGKTVTTVRGLALPAAGLKELGSRLKRKCGSGGSIRNGVLEIQGDHVDKLIEELNGLGYTVKRSGG